MFTATSVKTFLYYTDVQYQTGFFFQVPKSIIVFDQLNFQLQQTYYYKLWRSKFATLVRAAEQLIAITFIRWPRRGHRHRRRATTETLRGAVIIFIHLMGLKKRRGSTFFAPFFKDCINTKCKHSSFHNIKWAKDLLQVRSPFLSVSFFQG